MRKYGVMKLKLKCFRHFKQDVKMKANNIVYNLKTGIYKLSLIKSK